MHGGRFQNDIWVTMTMTVTCKQTSTVDGTEEAQGEGEGKLSAVHWLKLSLHQAGRAGGHLLAGKLLPRP